MKSTRSSSAELPTLEFGRREEWAAWLDINHTSSTGVWLRIAKVSSGIVSVSYAEALEVALCYGWIDSQKKSDSESAWLQKFTPRGERSIWSQINREKAEELMRNGLMTAAGLRTIERAQQDGRWAVAYDSFSKASVPEDLQAALDKNARAKDFFATLTGQNRYAILHRIQTAKKAETRAGRIDQFVRMLENHETLYPAH